MTHLEVPAEHAMPIASVSECWVILKECLLKPPINRNQPLHFYKMGDVRASLRRQIFTSGQPVPISSVSLC